MCVYALLIGLEMTAQVINLLHCISLNHCSSHSEPPQNLTLTPTASDQLQFSWGPPNITEEFEVNLYFVLFQGNKYTIDPSSDQVMVFDSLTPFTTYNCCVAASTTSGPSMLACATQTTLESGMFQYKIISAK